MGEVVQQRPRLITVAEEFARALAEEATKKAGLVWLTVAGSPGAHMSARTPIDTRSAQAVWHVWHESAVCVVGGGIEQPLPDFGASEVIVTVPSKDKGGRLVSWVAKPRRLEPGTPDWKSAAAALHAQRLNPPDGEREPQRWAKESQIWRLEPTGATVEQPGGMPDTSEAAEPRPTTATTRGPLPFVFGRRPRRRRSERLLPPDA